MTEDLIARLKAAHEAATPGPLRVKREIGGYEWVFDARDEVVMEGESGDLALYVLTRNALPEIIAALEERERMRAVVDAARAYRDRMEAEAATVEPWDAPEIDGGIWVALKALDEKS